MNKRSFWYRTFDLYYDGFRSMTLGKKLWLVILIITKIGRASCRERV